MNQRLRPLLVVLFSLSPFPLVTAELPTAAITLASPHTRLGLTFQLDAQGHPGFEVTFQDVPVAAGALGLEFAGSGPLNKNMKVVGAHRTTRDETYKIPVGKASSARDRHNELTLELRETSPPHRRLNVVFRAFDDGIAFRYEIPESEQAESLTEFVLTDELTHLRFPGDPTARVLPLNSYKTSYEKYYETLPVSKINSMQLLGLPLLLERKAENAKPVWVAVTEANLTDYAGLYLSGIEAERHTLAAKLSPLPGRQDGAKVIGEAPFVSPWRVLMIADNFGRLIESNIVFHLSDPPAIEDTSWIKPGKTTFPWWNHYVLEGVNFEPGVNTATMKHYIDFCAEQGIPYHSLDGLDIAWYGGPIRPNGPTDVTTAAPSIDLPELLRYAEDKGVRLRLWMHWKALKPQIDEAFATYERWGIEGVMVDFMDRDDQEMVRFYHELARKAAEHHLTVTLHGAYKPTGMERTWPNVLSYEAVLNQEYNKWRGAEGRGARPEHNLDVAFIRMLAGPLDYHQGGMRNVLPEDYQFRNVAPPVQGTRGHQLAMYVVYLNHLPMMADYPAAYRGQPGLNFLVEVPTNWDETRVLHADMGHCLVIARRKGDNWYLGGMTAGEARTLSLPLDFLGEESYAAELYLDEPAESPTALTLRRQKVSTAEPLEVTIPRAGGFAGHLTPIAE